MQKTLSIIIPTYNRKEILKKTLLSLCGQTSKDFEVIVADDGSNDGTGELIRTLELPYPILHIRQENSGRSAARNSGVLRSGGKILLFIDDHIITDKRLIEEHIKCHEKYNLKGARVIRGKVAFIKDINDIPLRTGYIEEGKIEIKSNDQDPFKNFHTNNISICRDAFLEVGGFDEDFKEYGLQDSEMGLRLKEAGYKFKSNPNAIGYIFPVGLSFEERCSRKRQIGHSSVLFYKKHSSVYIKFMLGVHFLIIPLYYLLSFLIHILPNSKMLALNYNFTKGVKDGLILYSARKFKKFHSRFKERKYNILLVSHSSNLSGAPVSLSLLAKNLDISKFNPFFIGPNGPIIEQLKNDGIETLELKWPRIFSAFKLIKEKNIDLLHANTYLSLPSAWAGRIRGIPVISHIREDLSGINNYFVTKEIELVSTRIVLISNWMKSFFKTKKAVVIHNGVNLGDFEKKESTLRTKLQIGKDIPLIGIIGSIEKRKGIHTLIKSLPEIIKELKNLKLLIVGSPPGSSKAYLEYLKSLSKILNIEDGIIFLGAREDIPNILSALDVLAVPSSSEPFGRTVIEAMAASCPVVASNVGGIPEIVEDGATGFLVKPGDVSALAQKIISMLKNDEKRKSMGAAGRERVEKLFSIGVHTKNIEKLYLELLEGK